MKGKTRTKEQRRKPRWGMSNPNKESEQNALPKQVKARGGQTQDTAHQGGNKTIVLLKGPPRRAEEEIGEGG